MRLATLARQRLAQRDIVRPQVARRELRRLVLDRVRLEIRHGLGSVRDIPILAQRAVWMCPTSGLQESQAWKGFLPTKRMRSPAFQLALRFKGAKQGSLAFSQACDPQSGVARRPSGRNKGGGSRRKADAGGHSPRRPAGQIGHIRWWRTKRSREIGRASGRERVWQYV